MVKTTGPMMSMKAAGKVGGSLVFSNWKGRPTLRKLSKPSQPQTGLQVASRAMMKFLGIHWSEIIPGVQATWEDEAAAKGISPFNAYVSEALSRWRRFLAPFDNANRVKTPADGELGNCTYVGGVRQITVTWGWNDKYEMCAVIIHRKASSGESATLNNVVAVINTPIEEEKSFVDTPLVPGTYYYDLRVMGTGGIFSAVQKSGSATCT